MSNPDLRPSHALELLAALKETAATFAEREEQHTREFATRRHAIARKQRDMLEKVETRLVALTAEAEAEYLAAKTRLTTRYEGRRTRVNRLGAAALRKLPLRARQTKERWMGDLQLQQFQSDRKLEADQKAADAWLADFHAQLAAQQGRLTELRRKISRSFAGYLSFQKLLRPESMRGTSMVAGCEPGVEELVRRIAAVDAQLAGFRQHPVVIVFSYALSYILFPLLGALVLLCALFSPAAAISAGALAVAALALHHIGWRQARQDAQATAEAFAAATQQYDATTAAAHAEHQEQRACAQQEHEQTRGVILEQWNRADQIEVDFEHSAREKIETQIPRLIEKIDRCLQPRLARVAASHDALVAQASHEAEMHRQRLNETTSAENAALNEEETARWNALAAEWLCAITPHYDDLRAIQAESSRAFPDWSDGFLNSWTAPGSFTPITRFAHLDATLAAFPSNAHLPLPGPAELSLPLTLLYPQEGSLLFETRESASAEIIATLNNVILRLFTTSPPGKAAFTIIDPVGLGQNFAGLMHFSDYEEALISRRIWTQRDQIEERLADLSEHIEKVIQMYLRNEYASITEYNEQAGSTAEKYHFLVVADFPVNFSETAARRLQSIATSGARCGVFTLIHWDERQELPDSFVPDELRKNSLVLQRVNGRFVIANAPPEAAIRLVFDAPPDDNLAAKFVHKIGQASVDSNRVEVPFSQIAPAPGELWTNDTTNELRIAIGRTGATKHQYLAIGKGTRQHALFAGKTGSGKSTLFHVIITNLALACSPEQVEFYLIDFKKGVEFKCYAEKRLPHARVVAIESDREFALSVLQRVDEELKRRGDMFRKLGVQDVAGYKRAGGTAPMPRTLLLIDEFQEFFVEDDTIAQTASLLFDRIVRQGRAFGIHVLLGSQTLGGAYSLARATLGQMVIRVALQCNEADAYLIMDDNNSAPRLLSRPGEGIYNDAAGAIEGNSPFQVVWLSDRERDARLDEIQTLVEQRRAHYPSPIVFEGNAPADILENDLLRAAIDHPPVSAPQSARAWLGAPNSIKGPTEAVFQQQSGNNLIIIGQRDEAALTMLGLSLLALAAQHPETTAKFILIQSATPGSPDAEFLDRIVAAVPHQVTVSRGPEITQIMSGLAAEVKTRSSGEVRGDAPAIFVLIHGLHRFKKLRQEDDFSFSMNSDDAGANPAGQFVDVITEGSSQGIHLLVSIDTFNNVNRSLSRKALTEFEMRVVFQMSANDSASLIDSPKASTLGLHRALYYNEQAGTLETFRPYAAPDRAWLTVATERLTHRRGDGSKAPPVEVSEFSQREE